MRTPAADTSRAVKAKKGPRLRTILRVLWSRCAVGVVVSAWLLAHAGAGVAVRRALLGPEATQNSTAMGVVEGVLVGVTAGILTGTLVLIFLELWVSRIWPDLRAWWQDVLDKAEREEQDHG